MPDPAPADADRAGVVLGAVGQIPAGRVAPPPRRPAMAGAGRPQYPVSSAPSATRLTPPPEAPPCRSPVARPRVAAGQTFWLTGVRPRHPRRLGPRVPAAARRRRGRCDGVGSRRRVERRHVRPHPAGRRRRGAGRHAPARRLPAAGRQRPARRGRLDAQQLRPRSASPPYVDPTGGPVLQARRPSR